MKRLYPNLTQHPDIQIRVSIAKQRVYLESQHQTLYTMLAPTIGFLLRITASISSTRYQLTRKGITFIHETEQLGKVANSHGCVRLTIADAKWLYESIPTHTPMTIS